MNFQCKFRHHLSIPQPWFLIRVQNFRDLATFCRWFLHFICWMSAVFLLPVCLTYWPKKYTTRVDPHVDNSHQVWSRYDNPLPSYSVFVCWYLDLWPFDVEQLAYMTDHVTTSPPSLKTLCLSFLELWVIMFPVGYHWKCVCSHCAWVGGQKPLHFWNPRPRFACSLYNFYWATMTIKFTLERHQF